MIGRSFQIPDAVQDKQEERDDWVRVRFLDGDDECCTFWIF